jgi:hypothetical protein
MSYQRLLKWSGPLGVCWIWIFEETDRLLRHEWHARDLGANVTKSVWFGFVAIYILVLALAALATYRTMCFKRSVENRPVSIAWSLLPHILLCGVLMGTSLALESPAVFDGLRQLGLVFLGRFLFYVAVVWCFTATLNSLLPPSDSGSVSRRTAELWENHEEPKS